MISERQFSTLYTSFWRQALPLADSYVRNLNLAVGRFASPLESESKPDRHGLINELSFRILESTPREDEVKVGELVLLTASYSLKIDEKNLPKVISETMSYISSFPGKGSGLPSPPTEAETEEAIDLAQRLHRFLRDECGSKPTLFRPSFEGCGILDSCEGDILCGDTLVEVKAGDRTFRSIDLRQVLAYCALNHINKKYKIEGIAIVNPRYGVASALKLTDVVRGLAACSPTELFDQIIEFLTLTGISI